MAAAREPWWVIGSAAVVLHGGTTAVGDVDILLSVADAGLIAAALGIVVGPGGEHPLFRSTLFFVWNGTPLTVEFMAGFAVGLVRIDIRRFSTPAKAGVQSGRSWKRCDDLPFASPSWTPAFAGVDDEAER
ncbi:hypothetical protein SAMN04488241_101186 [Sphingomonas rubra]|uniref:Uncharacterized protein n=2 Tax=Sphingomonas rubra TaxID=634430 RepID=A0A1I5PS97_9SPHN|nr:hypothetical protein SAMN04488241_101186 [Sphingomonas rubra]